jgi:hypothetical protein
MLMGSLAIVATAVVVSLPVVSPLMVVGIVLLVLVLVLALAYWAARPRWTSGSSGMMTLDIEYFFGAFSCGLRHSRPLDR